MKLTDQKQNSPPEDIDDGSGNTNAKLNRQPIQRVEHIDDGSGNTQDIQLKEQRNWLQRFLGFHSSNYAPTFSKEELEKLKWELEKHLSTYKDYSSFGLQAVGIFAAVVGGILSISFGGGANPDVKRFLLEAAYIMSLVFGSIFTVCGFLWFRVSNEARWIARRLNMIKFPDIIYLSYLLWLFGILFFVLSGGLDSLKGRVL